MDEKKIRILQMLQQKGRVSVKELSRELACSAVTVRTKIKELSEAGQLIRVHGGALRADEGQEDFDRKYHGRHIHQHVAEKKSIAACAYRYIEDQDIILLDDSTTCFYLALFIKAHPEKNVAVVTNSLASANELANLSHVELYMIGGNVGGFLPATMGELAEKSIAGFKVEKAFIGVHSINFEIGLTSIAAPQMQIKQAILRTADQVYVLADSSKFGNGYFSVICPMDEVHQIITDNHISESNRQKAEALHIQMVIAE